MSVYSKARDLRTFGKTKIPYKAAGMARMKDPTNTLGKSITWIDDATEVGEEDLAGFAPILNGKILNVDVTRSFGGLVCINHFDG